MVLNRDNRLFIQFYLPFFQLMYELVGVLKTIILELFIQQENTVNQSEFPKCSTLKIQSAFDGIIAYFLT